MRNKVIEEQVILEIENLQILQDFIEIDLLDDFDEYLFLVLIHFNG
jgi:hypothetical protein